MITHHTELLNALIERCNLKSYLEIGVQNPANNFDKVKCELKDGVDPCLQTAYAGPVRLIGATSDEYFERWKPIHTIDLVFIDGLHHADQVKRDFENSLRCLSDNGFIVIHDVLPDEEQFTIVPRQTKKWFGSVYQFAMSIGDYAGIGYKTFNIDCGCMLIWKDATNKNDAGKNLLMKYDWNLYSILGRILMNVTDHVEI